MISSKTHNLRRGTGVVVTLSRWVDANGFLSEGFVEGVAFDILTICIWPLTKTKIGGTLCCSSPWPSKMNAWQVREMIQGGCRVETADFGETESFVVVGSLDPAISRSDVFTISERLGSVSLEMGLMCKESFLVQCFKICGPSIYFSQLCHLVGGFCWVKDIPILRFFPPKLVMKFS